MACPVVFWTPPAKLRPLRDGRLREAALTELSEVPSRERLRRYGPVELARAHVERARRIGVFVEVGEEEARVVRDDPKDDYLVALARASGAYCIDSGDPHLTNLEVGRQPCAFG